MRRKNRLFIYLSLAACALACLALLANEAAAQTKTTRRGRRHTSSRTKPPLTKGYLLDALPRGKPTAKGMVALVKSRGVDFQPTEEDESQLRAAGATPELLEAVRDNYRPPPVIAPPHLPVPATIAADPSLLPPDTRETPQGGSGSGPGMSNGPGRGGGVGSGGGIGAGEGTGIGPGRGSNTGGDNDGNVITNVYRSDQVTKKAVVTSMPQPGYTEEARQNNISGTVRLRVILTAEGAVTHISVIKSLPYGLSERAVAAAKRIRFTPAEKDGHPVSQWAMIEYNFTVY